MKLTLHEHWIKILSLKWVEIWFITSSCCLRMLKDVCRRDMCKLLIRNKRVEQGTININSSYQLSPSSLFYSRTRDFKHEDQLGEARIEQHFYLFQINIIDTELQDKIFLPPYASALADLLILMFKISCSRLKTIFGTHFDKHLTWLDRMEALSQYQRYRG